MQINICVYNCIEVIDASVLSSDNSQLKLTTIGHRTGPYSLSELFKISLHTESPQAIEAICTSIVRFVPDHKKINCLIASCFVFFLSFFPCIHAW